MKIYKKLFNILIIVIIYNYCVFFHALNSMPAFLQGDHFWNHQTVQKMSLRQKIGQLFIATVEQENTLASVQLPSCNGASVKELIGTYQVGGIIFLGKKTIADQIACINAYQRLTRIPLVVLEDLEWGLSMRLADGLRFPRNLTLGAIQDEALVYELGFEIGNECRAIGVHVNLAPVVDINTHAANPVIGTRSFGENPQSVARLGALFMQGLQDAGILACAKHFPGHGDTSKDSHCALPILHHDRKRFETIELYPFEKLIQAGVDAIMPGHLKVPVFDPHAITTLSYRILTTLLKKELGFKGLVISDALNMGALSHEVPGQAELQALLAGNDVLVCSRNIPKAIDTIERAVLDGSFSIEELNKKVLKILQAKEYVGLAHHRMVDPIRAQKHTHTEKALQLKKDLYAGAVTLVKNKNHLLPLTSLDHHTCLIQIGGKQESYFAQKFKRVRVPSMHISMNPSQKTVREVLSYCATKKTIIIGLFDILLSAKHKNFGISSDVLQLITQLKNHNKQIILSIFGNPYSLALFGKEDAIVMAYEDDVDAQEAAYNVIIGNLNPRGTLPVTISKQFYYGLGLAL